MTDEQTFKVGQLPEKEWGLFELGVFHAVRVEGPFTVETSDGPVRCEDGWLAIDDQGNPYPIPEDEFNYYLAP